MANDESVHDHEGSEAADAVPPLPAVRCGRCRTWVSLQGLRRFVTVEPYLCDACILNDALGRASRRPPRQ